MATIRTEVLVDVSLETAWDAARDVGQVHKRLVPGFLTDVRLELDKNERIVTFYDGTTARERMISVDDAAHRVAWTIIDGPFEHHNGVAQVFREGPNRCRFVWTTDLLPDTLEATIAPMMERAMPILKRTLEQAERAKREERHSARH